MIGFRQREHQRICEIKLEDEAWLSADTRPSLLLLMLLLLLLSLSLSLSGLMRLKCYVTEQLVIYVNVTWQNNWLFI